MIEQGGVLFLDLSTQVGWAYGTLALVERGPEWGVWLLPNQGLGRRLAAFENELEAAIEQFEPSIVSIEAPLPAQQQSNAQTAELLICLAGVAELACYRWERHFLRRAVNTLRTQVCGRSQRTEQETDDRLSVKDCIVKPWIEARGWNITDHNARDAAIGWAYEIGMRAPPKGKPRA